MEDPQSTRVIDPLHPALETENVAAFAGYVVTSLGFLHKNVASAALPVTQSFHSIIHRILAFAIVFDLEAFRTVLSSTEVTFGVVGVN